MGRVGSNEFKKDVHYEDLTKDVSLAVKTKMDAIINWNEIDTKKEADPWKAALKKAMEKCEGINIDDELLPENRFSGKYVSEKNALLAIAKIAKLTTKETKDVKDEMDETSQFMREFFSQGSFSQNIKDKIALAFKDNPEEKLIEILREIHVSWIISNPNKFQMWNDKKGKPRDTEYQFDDLLLMKFDEDGALADKIFVDTILKSLGIKIDEKKLEEVFMKKQKEKVDYIIEKYGDESKDFHKALVAYLQDGEYLSHCEQLASKPLETTATAIKEIEKRVTSAKKKNNFKIEDSERSVVSNVPTKNPRSAHPEKWIGLDKIPIRSLIKEDDIVANSMASKIEEQIEANKKRQSGNYFTNEEYFKKAKNLRNLSESSPKHTIGEAFMLLIHIDNYEELDDEEKNNVDKLDNFLEEIKIYYDSKGIDLTLDECFNLTQGKSIDGKVQTIDDNVKRKLYELSINCIEKHGSLGKKKEGNHICSAWMGHCILAGKASGKLAKKLNLTPEEQEQAIVNGIVHDIGRKKYHDWKHIIAGCEYLMDKGWNREAIACMTHSFLNGGRNCNNEKALPGLKFDDKGNEYIDSTKPLDHISEFLKAYGEYTELDLILNVADLMATSNKIVSPEARLTDIEKRRKIDPTNRAYFLKRFTTILSVFSEKMGCKESNLKKNINGDLREIKSGFSKISKIFFGAYEKGQSKKQPNKNEGLGKE